MKKQIASTMVVVFLGGQLAAVRAMAGDCGTAQDVCDKYKTDEAGWVSKVCNLDGEMPSNLSVEEFESQVGICKENAHNAYGQIAPSCQVMDFSKKHVEDQWGLGLCYAAVAATCFAAAVAEKSGFGSPAKIACVAASATIGVIDFSVMLARKDESQKAITGMDVAGGAVAALGGGLVNGVITGTAKSATQKTSSMLTAVFSAGLAMKKLGGISGTKATRESACSVIASDLSNGIQLTGGAIPLGDTGGGTINGTGSSGGTVSSGSTGESQGGGDSSSDFSGSFSSADGFANAATAAGKLDPKLGEFFRQVPPKELFNALKGSMPDIGKAAAAAASGGSFGDFGKALASVGGYKDADGQLAKSLAASEALLKKRIAEQNAKLAAEMSYGKAGAGTKAGAAAAKTASPFGFGFGLNGGGDGAAGGPDALKFTGAAKVAEPLLEAVGDIYHSADKGSIFQIVSRRLGRAQDKVEVYEWDSPGNRVRQNLPWKPATEGLRKPAAVGTQ